MLGGGGADEGLAGFILRQNQRETSIHSVREWQRRAKREVPFWMRDKAFLCLICWQMRCQENTVFASHIVWGLKIHLFLVNVHTAQDGNDLEGVSH